MTKKPILEINSASLLALILIFVNSIYLVEGIKTAPLLKDGVIGVTFFPVIISILFYIAAFAILIAGIREKKGLSFYWPQISRPTVVIFLTFVYVVIFNSIGYFLSSILYVFGLMLLFEDKVDLNKKKYLNIVYSIFIVILIYILYEKLFGVRLPVGEVF